MPYKRQPIPSDLLETAIDWETLRAAYFDSLGDHYKGAKQDALLRAEGHRNRLIVERRAREQEAA